MLKDLSSLNGVRVNDDRVSSPVTLSSGDTLNLGGYSLTFTTGVTENPPGGGLSTSTHKFP